MRHAAWLVMAVAVAACGPETDQRPMLLLDPVARANGFELKVGDWKGAPVTPISVTPMDDVVLAGPTGTQHLTPRPGALGHIEGHLGTLRWRSLGADLDLGRLVVRGDADAVHRIATTLDARAVQHGEGQWTLEGEAVLEQSAWLEVPSGVSEVEPVERQGPQPPQVPSGSFRVAAIAPSSVKLVDEVPAFVGVYLSADDETLVLDASGGYQLMHQCELSGGHFYALGPTLMLVSDDGARRELMLGSDGQLTDNFASFVPAFKEAP